MSKNKANPVIYRHFKGGYYIMRTMATIESTGDTVAVYESLQDGRVWTRPLSEFYDDVSDKEGNITGQKHRFEPVTDFQYQMSLIPTETLMQELLKRSDCPVELKTLDPERVWKTEYLVGKFRPTFIDVGNVQEDFYFENTCTDYEKAAELLQYTNDPNMQILIRAYIKQDFDYTA